MYQPDGIVAFKKRGVTYLATANEGDARDYDGFSEEERGSDIRGDYPGIADLTASDRARRLGRLNFTTSPPVRASSMPLPDKSRPYTFGARSISIWNAHSGELVWDSGADLEVLAAAVHPEDFNAGNVNEFDEDDPSISLNFDNRSDNKGPEPEGIDVGVINGRTYAFVALERIGGVATFDITDLEAPEIVDYFNDRDFDANPVEPDAGPEVVHFVSALASPNGKPMLVVANEITGTVALWGLEDARPWWHFLRSWQRWRPHR
jgi:hypothetical protein